MDHSCRKWFVIMICGSVLVLAASCAKKVSTTEQAVEQPKAETPPAPVAKEQPKPQPETPAPPPEVRPPAARLEDVFFDFDKALLRPDSGRILNEDARWMKENSDARITVEGHCDERGTVEYNLALGERRARAVKQHLETLGLDSNRIKTISYGKERPFCQAHNEQCWQENRRDHFLRATSGG